MIEKIKSLCGSAVAAVEKRSSSPGRVIFVFAAVITVFYTVQCSLLQNVLGLDVLETISWGAQGALGHAKHPPLSGWLGYGFSKLAGHQDWIMYFAAQMCMALSVFYVWRSARLFFDQYTSGVAAIFLYFLFYYNPSETRFCTYPIETFLVPAGTYYFFKVLKDNRITDHLLLAVITAAGLLNKYSFALVIAGWAVIFLKDKKNFRILKTFKPYCTVIFAVALLFPHIMWLIENDFVCFKHVGSRLSDEHFWYTPLVTAGTALYPYALAAVLLLLTYLPGRKTAVRKEIDRKTGIDALIIGGLPAAVLVVLSVFGSDIIMMWFCTMAGFSGIAMAAFFPWKIDRKFFAGFVVLLIIYCAAVMIGTTIDLLASSRVRLHSDPKDYTVPAEKFFAEHAGKKIPVVVGTRFEATVLENYLPYRPPACEVNDPVSLERCRKKIAEHGALLIGHPNAFEGFRKETEMKELSFRKITYRYKAVWGRKRTRVFYLSFLPPGMIKNEKNNR